MELTPLQEMNGINKKDKIHGLKSPEGLRKTPNFQEKLSGVQQQMTLPERRKEATTSTGRPRHDHTPEDGLPNDFLLHMYQKCLTLSSENKINQKNTWELKLIDHISDIVKVEAESNNQTNFQKASCTLEAGVKIYSYRVDSVHTETWKVLAGLNRTTVEQEHEQVFEEGILQDDTEFEESADGDPTKLKDPKKRISCQTVTLESWESLNVKKIDVAFSVDPLFHQTSAQFDEGGARGLLLNNLSNYRGCEIVFDSSDVPEMQSHPSSLRGDMVLHLTFMEESIDSILEAVSMETDISPTLSEIVMFLEEPRRAVAQAKMPQWTGTHSTEDRQASAAEGKSDQWFDANSGDGNEDSFEGAAGDTYDNVEGNGPSSFNGDGDDGNIFDDWGAQDEGAAHISDEWAEETSIETVGGLNPADWLASVIAGGGGKSNAWAGPEHWRYRKPKVPSTDPQSKTAKPRRRKEPFHLDFSCRTHIDESRFAPAADPSKTFLPRTGMAKTLLPTDHHYDALKLVKLYRRPNVYVPQVGQEGNKSGRRQNAPARAQTEFVVDDDWCDGDDGTDIPDVVGFADSHESVESGINDGQSDKCQGEGGLIAQPRKVQKVEVAYARTSKQVDVKVLKETLWDLLQEKEHAPHGAGHVGEGQSFQEILNSFPQNCQAADMADISVHLCFICVLHLANEHNLAITDVPSMDELTILHVPTKA